MWDIAPFDYLQTFLRQHIAACLGLRINGPTPWEPFRALHDLRGGCIPDEHLSLLAFFRGDPTADRPGLYQPVRVQCRAQNALLSPPTAATDVSTLLQNIRGTAELNGRGIYLESPSGHGKTVALWKAFVDCVDPVESAPLRGYLPLWLSTGVPNPSPAPTWQELICQAHLVPQSAPTYLAAWLRYGPPLLMLCDLEAIPFGSRAAVVAALMTFQRESRLNGNAHCVVLASTGNSLVDRNHLRRCDDFLRCELFEWRPPQVVVYAEALSRWRGQAAPAGLSPGLIDSMDPRSPFIVHSLAMTPPGTGDRWSRGQCYRHIICETLQRHQPRFVSAPGFGVMDQGQAVLAGSTRLALWLLFGQAVVARAIDLVGFMQVVFMPPSLLPSVHRRFWQTGHQSWYYRNPNPLGPFPTLVLDHNPFVRADTSGRVRFVSETVQDYFAVVGAIRYFCTPDLPCAGLIQGCPDWFMAALVRLTADFDRWQGAVHLLGGVLEADDLQTLIALYLRLAPIPGGTRYRRIPEVLCGLLEGWERGTHPVLDVVREAFRDFLSDYAVEDRHADNFRTVLAGRMGEAEIARIEHDYPLVPVLTFTEGQ